MFQHFGNQLSSIYFLLRFKQVKDAAKKHTDYYFGVLDGFDFKDALSGFNVFYEELPRLLVVEKNMDGYWEDVKHLPVRTKFRNRFKF